jgi:hypothetical protein
VSQFQLNPTLGQVLNSLKDVAKRQIRVAMPAQINAYNSSTQTVDVQPLVDDQIQQEDGTFVAMPFPVVTNVPVAFLGGGGFRLTFPVRSGDTGLLVIADLSLDEWQKEGGHVTPADQRRHHIADGVFLPGLHADPQAWHEAPTDAAAIGTDGGPEIVLRSGTVELGGSDALPPLDFALKGTTFVDSDLATVNTAWDTFLTALDTFNIAIGTYATGIQPTADPMSSFTPALLAAVATFTAAATAMLAAVSAFQAGAVAELSTIVKIG